MSVTYQRIPPSLINVNIISVLPCEVVSSQPDAGFWAYNVRIKDSAGDEKGPLTNYFVHTVQTGVTYTEAPAGTMGFYLVWDDGTGALQYGVYIPEKINITFPTIPTEVYWGTITSSSSSPGGIVYTVNIDNIGSTADISSLFKKSASLNYTAISNGTVVPLLKNGSTYYVLMNELPEEHICT